MHIRAVDITPLNETDGHLTFRILPFITIKLIILIFIVSLCESVHVAGVSVTYLASWTGSFVDQLTDKCQVPSGGVLRHVPEFGVNLKSWGEQAVRHMSCIVEGASSTDNVQRRSSVGTVELSSSESHHVPRSCQGEFVGGKDERVSVVGSTPRSTLVSCRWSFQFIVPCVECRNVGVIVQLRHVSRSNPRSLRLRQRRAFPGGTSL